MTGFRLIERRSPSRPRNDEQYRADVFDPGDTSAGGNGLRAEMDIDDDARPSAGWVEWRAVICSDRRLSSSTPSRLSAACSETVAGSESSEMVSAKSSCSSAPASCSLVFASFMCASSAGFSWSAPLVVLVLAKQLEGFGGLGQYADRFGAAYLHSVGVALPTKNVGDPVDGRFEPDGIPGVRAGDDQLQPMLIAAAEPPEPLRCSRNGTVLSADRIGLDDGCIKQTFVVGSTTPCPPLGRSVRPQRRPAGRSSAGSRSRCVGPDRRPGCWPHPARRDHFRTHLQYKRRRRHSSADSTRRSQRTTPHRSGQHAGGIA